MAAKEQFLEICRNEYQKTMRVLRAYPGGQLELRPHARCRTARDLAWVFALERSLGVAVLNDHFARNPVGGKMPEAPAAWDDILGAMEKGQRDFVGLIESLRPEQMEETVSFMTGPKQMGKVRRMDFCWFLLHDEIHHRGQFTIYLRMAGGKVPSIYGPSGDEPWT